MEKLDQSMIALDDDWVMLSAEGRGGADDSRSAHHRAARRQHSCSGGGGAGCAHHKRQQRQAEHRAAEQRATQAASAEVSRVHELGRHSIEVGSLRLHSSGVRGRAPCRVARLRRRKLYGHWQPLPSMERAYVTNADRISIIEPLNGVLSQRLKMRPQSG